MPSLKDIRESIAELPKGPPLVAAITSGTTGIGSYLAKALATTYADSGSKLRVYIVGRNKTRGDAVVAEGKKLSPGSEWEFVQATDLALISEVDRCCEYIIKKETENPFHGGPVRLDLLHLSHCYPILAERSTTKEGLDAFISTTYYSRIRFIMKLLPLLTESPLAGNVVSVYAGGFEDGTKPGELPIGCPPDDEYGVNGVRKYSVFMKTFLFEDLAEQHAGKLRLTHIFPGLVDGPGFESPDMPRWFRLVWKLVKPLFSWYMTAPDVCGQVMLYLTTPNFPAQVSDPSAKTPAGPLPDSTKGVPGGGAYATGQRADAIKGMRYEKVRKDDTNKLVWDHTMDTLKKIEEANAKTAAA